ncbi:MAG TPA: hypothetical protein VHK47_17015, partial [Polyangia bacterium]|nr:hypothetical protein [Polyangia bacterium]
MSQIPLPARRRRAGWLAAAAVALSCGSTPPSDGRPVTRQVITVEGGQVSVSSGRFRILVPKDALKRDTAITILQVDAPAVGAVAPVYEVGPTGTEFQRPATLSFNFAALDVSPVDVPNLHVATLWNGQWVPVASNVDRLSSVVTGQISHLSPWTLIVYAQPLPPAPDAGSEQPDGGADADPVDGAGDGAAGGQAGADAAGSGGTTGTAGTTGSGGAGGTTGAADTTGHGGAGGTT